MKSNTVITPAESRRVAIRGRKTKRQHHCLAKQNIRRALETQTSAAIRIYSFESFHGIC